MYVRRVLSAQDAATMRLMLTAATEEKATGANARIPGYHVAGKTGTAQKVDPNKRGYVANAYISSFAGFVPAHNPRYVILISVDNPQKTYYGSQVAAPVFARMAQYLVRRAGLPPVLISESNVIRSKEEKKRSLLQAKALEDIKKNAAAENASGEDFPNVMGLTLREAMAQVRQRATHVEVRGSGIVVRTVPQPGAPLPGKHRVTLVLENPD